MFHLGFLMLLLTLALGAGTPARAVSLLRDGAVDHGLAQLADPLLRDTRPGPAQVRVPVVDGARMLQAVTQQCDAPGRFADAPFKRNGPATCCRTALAHGNARRMC